MNFTIKYALLTLQTEKKSLNKLRGGDSSKVLVPYLVRSRIATDPKKTEFKI
jgi:hypothetical protein